MSYYTIAHYLQGDLNGESAGSLGIKPEDLTHEVWDYIFKKGEYPANCNIPQDKLSTMRNEFEYWYPMDLRVSGKDLIRNHLTMSLYNHAGMWESVDYMPRSMYCNGYMVLNNEKMSKSSGNFLTMRDCLEKFGADATRITLADAGDGLDDANFDTDVANACILKLTTLEKWIDDNIKSTFPNGGIDLAEHKANFDLWDSIFENAINASILNTSTNFDEMKYKQVMKTGFFELQNIKEDYLIAKNNKPNPFVLMRYITAQLVMMNPIIPHFTQFIWNTFVYPVLSTCQNFGEVQESLNCQPWPVASAAPDKITSERLSFLKDVKGTIRQNYENAKKGGGKKPKKGEAAEQVAISKCTVLVAKEYPAFQK